MEDYTGLINRNLQNQSENIYIRLLKIQKNNFILLYYTSNKGLFNLIFESHG